MKEYKTENITIGELLKQKLEAGKTQLPKQVYSILEKQNIPTLKIPMEVTK